jgi:hypothetical protein
VGFLDGVDEVRDSGRPEEVDRDRPASEQGGHNKAQREPPPVHTVELIWSVKSGKTRLLWDGNDVTHLFPPEDTKDRYRSVQLSWSTAPSSSSSVPHQPIAAEAITAAATTAATTTAVQVAAHADVATDLAGRPQYDLRVDGASYRALPTRDELLARLRLRRQQEQLQRQQEKQQERGRQQTRSAGAGSEPKAEARDNAAGAGAGGEELGVDKGEPPPPPPSSPGAPSSPSSSAPPTGDSASEPRHPGIARQQLQQQPGDIAGESGAGSPEKDNNGATEGPEVRDENLVCRGSSDGTDAELMSELGSGPGEDDANVARGESFHNCPSPSSTDFDFRLSMVGLKHVGNPSARSSPGGAGAGAVVVDELRSELYSPMLETLRLTISEHLPQLEDVVSRAIIRAFFADADSSHHSGSGLPTPSSPAKSQQQGDGHRPQDLTRCSSNASSTSRRSSASRRSGSANAHQRLDAVQLELDTLKAAYEFVEALPQADGTQEDSRSDSGLDLRHVFMQKQIDSICWLVRNDEVTPAEASRILLRLACLLELDFASPVPADTVLLAGLGGSATPQDAALALSELGEVSASAVSPGGFGLVRFRDPIATPRLEAIHDRISVQGKCPQVVVLSSSSVANQKDLESDERVHPTTTNLADDALRTDPPSLTSNRPDSPPETIPHLMALGEFCISFAAPNSSLSTIGTVPDKPRPISEATSSTGSSSTQGTAAAEPSSNPLGARL